MQVTITLNDNPQLLKAFKEMAKALNEPIKIKKKKLNEIDKAIQEFKNGDFTVCHTMEEFKKEVWGD